MEYELLLNRSKIKKNVEKDGYNIRFKKILEIIQSLNPNENLDDDCNDNNIELIPKFKQFLNHYYQLKKILNIEKEKHVFISDIIDSVLKKAIYEVELVNKKKIDIKNIVQENNTKIIKLN